MWESKNRLIAMLALALFVVSNTLAACAGRAAATPTQATRVPIPSTAEVEPTATSEATLAPTPTVDVLQIPTEEVVRHLLEGQIDYPVEFDDIKRAELAVAIAEYLNENVVADEAYVEMSFDNVGEVKIGWNPTTERWVSNHNTPESTIDFEGESLPPLIIPGYTNSEGREVFIDPETGQETIVPAINLPGMGEVSLTELYSMSQQELENYAVDLMLQATGNGKFPNVAEYISNRFNHFPLPVVMYENARNNSRVYQSIFRVTTEYSQVPEANTSFVDHATNGVLAPIIDQDSGQVLFWLSIQQGSQWGKSRSFRFFSNGEVSYRNALSFDALLNRTEEERDLLFGSDLEHWFAILVPGKTTATTYDIIGNEPLLESGVGVGSEEEINKLVNTPGNFESFTSLIKELNLRLLVLYPYMEIHQSSE